MVEGLIDYLDAMDGDPDQEPGDDAEMTSREWYGEGAQRFDVGLAA